MGLPEPAWVSLGNVISHVDHHRVAHTVPRKQTYDVCDPFVIITPGLYNIIASSVSHHRIASSPDRAHTCNIVGGALVAPKQLCDFGTTRASMNQVLTSGENSKVNRKSASYFVPSYVCVCVRSGDDAIHGWCDDVVKSWSDEWWLQTDRTRRMCQTKDTNAHVVLFLPELVA